MWLIVGQTPIKAGWWDASLALWDFSRINKALHPVLYNKYNLYLSLRYCNVRISEAVVWSCSVKRVFCKILQNSQEFPLNFETLSRNPFSKNTPSGCVWHLDQSRFPILILHVINQFSFFLWLSARLHFHMNFPQNNHFLH